MPMYEYVCEACGEHTDMIRPIKDRDEPVACIACGHPAERVMSTFAVGRGAGASSSSSSAGASRSSCSWSGG